MRQTIPYAFSKDHLHSKTLIYWCSDLRLREKVLSSFVSLNGFDPYDLICTPGGAAFLLGQYQGAAIWMQQALIDLHHFGTVVLTVHEDCGARGGSVTFDNDWKKERKALIEKLNEAVIVVKTWFPQPNLRIIRAIVSFKGFEMLD